MGRYGPRGDPRAAFDKFVRRDADGCWRWTGGTSGAKAGGHGQFWFGNRMVRAHRVAWELATGKSPGAMCVCHRCDNPLCVNPDHLFLGTQTDNIADMVAKGRQQRVPRPGEANTQARLTDDDVRQIRAANDAGEGRHAIAARYGISPNHAYRIATRRNWAHVA
jgi:hypothetical protein